MSTSESTAPSPFTVPDDWLIRHSALDASPTLTRHALFSPPTPERATRTRTEDPRKSSIDALFDVLPQTPDLSEAAQPDAESGTAPPPLAVASHARVHTRHNHEPLEDGRPTSAPVVLAHNSPAPYDASGIADVAPCCAQDARNHSS